MADYKSPDVPPPPYTTVTPDAPPAAYSQQYPPQQSQPQYPRDPQQYPAAPPQQYQPQQYPPQQYPAQPGVAASNVPETRAEVTAYYPSPGQQQPGVVIATPPSVTVVGGTVRWGESAVQVSCPKCQNNVLTVVSYEIGLLCWLIVLAIFLSGLIFFVTVLCCWIPCCINACKDIVHSCPSCHHVIARQKRLG